MLDDAVHHAGQDSLRMIRRFVATARRLDDRRVGNPDWVAALRTLRRNRRPSWKHSFTSVKRPRFRC